MVLPQLSPKQVRWALIVVTVILAIAAWAIGRYLSPAPPKTVSMSTGAAGGAYHAYGEQYAKALAAQGIQLKLMPSTGSIENLQRLNDGQASVGLVQSGLGTASTDTEDDDDTTPLRSLGIVSYEPVWIFSRLAGVEAGLGALKGKRVSIGVEGSGARKVALDLLAAYGLNATDVNTQAMTNSAAALALKAGQLDATIFVSSVNSPLIEALLGDPGIKLISLAQTGGIPAKLHYLQALTLKRGAISPARDLPAVDTPLLSTSANLVVRDDLHPAVAYLLLEAAKDVHRAATPFQLRGELPRLAGVDFPPANEATRYFKDGRPFLQRYLPFWLANFVQRLLLVIVPLVAIMVPLFKVLPGLLDMRDRTRLYRRYGELMFLENDLKARQLSNEEVRRARARLDEMERDVATMKLPLDFSDKLYTLRQHIGFVRERLQTEPTNPKEQPA